jgi:CBS domain-containing protein
MQALDLAPQVTPFDRPVTTYMARALETARAETPISEIAATMHARRISGVPVLDERARLIGVVTRTDLIALGALQAGRRGTSPAMPLPRRTAREVMTLQPLTIPRSASVRDAARVMATHAIHRVFVTDGDAVVGVIGAVDIAAAVHDSRAAAPLSTIMAQPLVTLAPRAPLSSAVDLLDRLRVNSLLVVDDGHLLGVFSQVEALATRDMLRSTPIELLYDPAVVCLPADTRLYRAAGHVARLDVRRVIVCADREPIGMVTALDFARYVAW